MPPPLENGKRTFSTKTRRERKGLGTSPFGALRLTTVPIPCVSCFRGIAVGPIGRIGQLGRRLRRSTQRLTVAPQGRSVAVEGLSLRACTLRGRGRFVPSGLHALFSVLWGGNAAPWFFVLFVISVQRSASSPPKAAVRASTSVAPPNFQASKLPNFQWGAASAAPIMLK